MFAKIHVHWLVLLATILVTGCATVPEANPESREPVGKSLAAPHFSLLFSQHRSLMMEPCGCSLNPLGGIVREWNFLEEKRISNAQAPLVYFWSGVTFGADSYATNPTYHSMKADFLLDAMNEMIAAFSPDTSDFSLGVKRLKELEARSKFPWVSTNIVDKSGKPIFKPFIEISRPNVLLPILVFGASEKAPKGVKGIQTVPTEKAIRKVLSSLPQKRRFVVVLSSLNPDSREKLLKAVPEINIIFGGDRNYPGEFKQLGPSTISLETMDRGRKIGVVDVTFRNDKPVMFNSTIALQNEEIANRTRSIIERIDEDLKTAKKSSEVAELKKDRQNRVGILSRVQTINFSLSNDGANYDYTIAPIGPDYDEPAKNPMSELFDKFQSALREKALKDS